MNPIKKNWQTALLAIIYTVGVIGFCFEPLRQNMAGLTWLTLLISFSFLILRHQHKSKLFWISILVIGLLGFFLEVIGVQTGRLFGEYQYGASLGIKLLDVPLMIAVNWMLLVYLSSFVARRVSKNPFGIIFIAAVLMTAMDVLIEPFAIEFDLWSWEMGHVPMQNYLAWFIISLGLNALFLYANPKLENRIAMHLVAMLSLFFLIVDGLVIWF